jgi:hypothetical protein
MAEKSRRELAEEAHQAIRDTEKALWTAIYALKELRPGSTGRDLAAEYVEDCRGLLDRARNVGVERLAAEPDD